VSAPVMALGFQVCIALAPHFGFFADTVFPSKNEYFTSFAMPLHLK
jgi:hypothetical protein